MPKVEVPTVLPEMDECTPEQVEQKKEFIAKHFPSETATTWPPAYRDYAIADLDSVAYKFLTARKWVMEDASLMFTETVKYRAERNLDNINLFPSAIPMRGFDQQALMKHFNLEPRAETEEVDKLGRATRPYYHSGFHYWDKSGHPVLYELTGRTKVKHLVKVYKSFARVGEKASRPCIDYHIHQNECGGKLVRYMDATMGKELGRRINTATVVLDFNKLSYGSLFGEAIDIMKEAWEVDKSYYPEGMHRLFAINCPKMIMFAYNIVKGSLDKRIQSKIVFCNPEQTTETLLQVIDAKHLPKFLGGECECEGGCIPMESEAGSDEVGDGDVLTEEITIPAGKDIRKKFALEVGSETAWEYESTTEKDIEFSVLFVPEGADDSKAITVVKPIKCKVDSGSYKAEAKGDLTIVWCNKFSWMNSKTLRLRAFKINS